MKVLQAIGILAVITLCTAFITTHSHEAETFSASIEVVSQDESEEITFEATLISYEADRTQEFETFGRLQLTTPFTYQIESSDFVGVFKKTEGSADMRVTMSVESDAGVNTLKCGAESCVVVRKDKNGYISGL